MERWVVNRLQGFSWRALLRVKSLREPGRLEVSRTNEGNHGRWDGAADRPGPARPEAKRQDRGRAWWSASLGGYGITVRIDDCADRFLNEK